MIITHVHLVLGTIQGYSKMCGFVIQHNATDVSSFEGACNWHAYCKNAHQSCCQRISCSFGSTSNWPLNRRQCVYLRVGAVYPMVGLWYGQA
jgi:hypothetical protein